MRVITLKQPWATLIAEGLKKYEFRTWKTNYKRKLLIHAGIGLDKNALNKYKHLNLEYPKSQILAKVEIVECIKLDKKMNQKIIKENELIYGSDINRKGYAWKLENIEKICYKKEIKGKLGLWNIDEL